MQIKRAVCDMLQQRERGNGMIDTEICYKLSVDQTLVFGWANTSHDYFNIIL